MKFNRNWWSLLSLTGKYRGERRRRPLVVVSAETLELRQLLSGTGHGGDAVLQGEHDDVMKLVPTAEATFVSKLDVPGVDWEWDDPNAWESGAIPPSVPTAGAKVLIPAGSSITLDSQELASLKWLRVDGALRFQPDVSTSLLVETIVISPSGELEIGTELDPIQAGVKATVTFADNGVIDSVLDPKQFSRGLISHGHVHIHGEHVESFVNVVGGLPAGASGIDWGSLPDGWSVGDRLVLAGINPANANDAETRTIDSITGTFIKFNLPLSYSHLTPEPQLTVSLANLDRNVIFNSQNMQIVSRRGHVMFMHSDHVEVAHVAFVGLGRTDKMVAVTDPTLDANQVLVPGTANNPRGRYAVHVHRAGLSNVANPVVVEGSVVEGSPGWGFVNHSSNVAFTDNVAFKTVGAAFSTEAGDEIGSFDHNLALDTKSSGIGREHREAINDFGHDGNGFWFQGGGGISVTDNVASGAATGFMYYEHGLNHNKPNVVKFLAANVLGQPAWLPKDNPNTANVDESLYVAVENVPIRESSGNTAYDTALGMAFRYHLGLAPHLQRSTVDNLTVWGLVNYGVALDLPYTNQMNVTNSTLLGGSVASATSQLAIGMINATRNVTYQNLRVEKFQVGIALPMQGTNLVTGGSYKNITNLQVSAAVNQHRVTTITEDVSLTKLDPAKGFNIGTSHDLGAITSPFFPFLFQSDQTLLPKSAGDRQLFLSEQSPSAIPFPAGIVPAWVPAEVIGKTNAVLSSQYGLMYFGALATPNAGPIAGIKGLVGTPAVYQSPLKLISPQSFASTSGYKLSYQYNGVTTNEAVATTLKAGWNLLTRTIDGGPRTLLVFCTAPVAPPQPVGIAGTLKFLSDTATVNESSGTITLFVHRVGGSDGAVSVTWATRAITALAGSDFIDQTGVISFAAGDTTPKSITIQIVNNNVTESMEQFRVVLSNPLGGATLDESLRRVYVDILDDDVL